jgi:hypothetical protein
LCHVLNRADVLQLTAFVPAVSDDVYILDRAIRHLQPELKLHLTAVTARSLNLLRECSQIFRVDSSTDHLKGHSHIRVNLEDAIQLL